MKFLKKFLHTTPYKKNVTVQEIEDILIEYKEKYGNDCIIWDVPVANFIEVRIKFNINTDKELTNKECIKHSNYIFLPLVKRLRKFGYKVIFKNADTMYTEYNDGNMSIENNIFIVK